jgi:molybdate transport system ATP-binding protein
MANFKHTAINGKNLAMSSPIIQQVLKGECLSYFPELVGKKGVLFSNTTLAKFIENEALHDAYNLTIDSKRSIRTFSSGEQKKALLSYLLNEKPDFLMLDNPFDALDTESVKNLKNKLNELSKQIPIIQVFKRRSDLLPFISHGMHLDGDQIFYADTIPLYLQKYDTPEAFFFNGTIPPPLNQYNINSDELVRFTNVDVYYEKRKILNTINWTIKPGEFWQLIGPNGSGKTTLLTMINGDNPKAYGQNIMLFGRQKGSGENVWQIKKYIGYFTPSMMELFKHRHSSEQMVVSGLVDSIGLYRKASELQMHLADRWLKLIGVYDLKKRPFISLSQVQQRMVLIARAMIKHPPLLILDEPSTGLDDYSAAMLSALINKMAEESNTSILYVSHRTEPDLNPKYIYKLSPTENGSAGEIVNLLT